MRKYRGHREGDAQRRTRRGILFLYPLICLALVGWVPAPEVFHSPPPRPLAGAEAPPSLDAFLVLAPPIELQLLPDGAVSVRLGALFETGGTARSLRSGLPVRIRIVVELWRDRFIDSQEGRYEWRGSVRLDPLTDRYLVETGDGFEQDVFSPEAARTALQNAVQVPLAPERSGSFYYLARVEVETLSLSDLDELRRWLQGELGPAVEGGGEVGSAVGRGVRRFLVRLLGLPVQRYETRTRTFEIGG